MAAVAWVGGTTFANAATSTTLAAAAPSGIANGDALFAAVYARSAITTPSGWTLLGATADFTTGLIVAHVSIFRKNTVTTADSGASFTWTQASSTTFGVVYAAARNVDTVTVSTATVNATATWNVTPAVQTADANGQLFILFGSTTNVSGAAQTPTAPTGATLFSGASLSLYRLAGAYQTRFNGEANSGSWNMAPTGGTATNNGLGAITIRLTTATPPNIEARISVASPLGAPAALATHRRAARVSCPSMLGAPSAFLFFDFSGQVAGQTPRYLMTLTTPGGTVTVPIGSWQATLQKDAACYVQCVVPACAPYVDDITAATAFAIYRTGTVLGVAYAYEMANATVESTQLSQGPRLYTALISGHSPAFAVDAGLPSSLDRPLADVRSVATETTGLRVRCAIDWLLRPGMNATLDATPFVVGTIGYYVADSDQYMDVRESVT